MRKFWIVVGCINAFGVLVHLVWTPNPKLALFNLAMAILCYLQRNVQ